MDTTVVECVIARSEITLGKEDAWVALKIRLGARTDHVVVVHYKSKDYETEAFARAAKHAKTLAENLSVPFSRKRADAAVKTEANVAVLRNFQRSVVPVSNGARYSFL